MAKGTVFMALFALSILAVTACNLAYNAKSERVVSPTAQDVDKMPPVRSLMPGVNVTVDVSGLSEAVWHVTYLFDEPQTLVSFTRSIGDYRRRTWENTDGLGALIRINNRDIIVFDTPAQKIEFTVTPYSDPLPREYRPFLKFSDGSGAVFLDQFQVEAYLSLDDLKADDAEEAAIALSTGIRLSGEHPIVLKGDVFDGYVERVLGENEKIYAYHGLQKIEEAKSYVGIIDQGMPEHILQSFDLDLRQIFSAYEQKWGFSLREKATIYFAFGGTDRQGWSFSGSVAGQNTVVLHIAGEHWLEPDEENRRDMMKFFAHEAAHLFQGAGHIDIGSSRQAWWHEGSADFMARDVLGDLDLIDPKHITSAYRQRIDTCGGWVQEQPLLGRQGQAPYWCGDLIALIIDAALPDHTVYDLWNRYISREDVEPAPDPDLIDDDVLDLLADLGAKDEILAQLRSLLEGRQEVGRSAWLKAFETAGIIYELDTYGSVTSITLP